jgi:hypothetical protein
MSLDIGVGDAVLFMAVQLNDSGSVLSSHFLSIRDQPVTQ